MTLSRPGALLALTLSMLAASIVTGIVGPGNVGGLPSGFSRPILAIEFVESSEQFTAIANLPIPAPERPSGTEPDLLRKSIFPATVVDCVLILVYLMLWWAWLSRIDRPARNAWWWWVTAGLAAISIAAVADAVENFYILRGLSAGEPRADVIRLAAVVKWAALGVVYVVLATGFARAVWKAKNSPRQAVMFGLPGLAYAVSGLLSLISLPVHRPWIEYVPYPIAVALLAQIPPLIVAIRAMPAPVKDPNLAESVDEVRKRELEYVIQRRAEAGLPLPSPEVVANTLVGLALSGGGIRSATTNLGILQMLSRIGILPKVDYLSTVSGGGYIGSCLTALLSLKHGAKPGSPAQFDYGTRDALRFSTRWETFPFNPDLQRTDGPCCEDTAKTTETKDIVSHLRTHGNFLVARRGLLKRDALRAAGHLLTSTLYNLLTTAAVLFTIAIAAMGLARVIEPDLHSAINTPTVAAVSTVVTVTPTTGWLGEYKVTKETPASVWQAIRERSAHVWRGIKADIGKGNLVRAAVVGALTTIATLIFFVAAVHQDRFPSRWGAGESRNDKFLRYTLNAAACGLVGSLLLVWSFVDRTDRDGNAGWIVLPFVLLTGARIAAFVVYVAIARFEITSSKWLRCWNPTFRSLWGAFQAMTTYGMIFALAFAAVPVLAYAATDISPWSALTPIGSLVMSRVLASGAAKRASATLRIPAGVLRFLLGLAVTVVIALTIVGFATLPLAYDFNPFLDEHRVRFIGAFALGLVAVAMLSVFGDINRISPHYFYRDRLLETYLRVERPKSATEKQLETLTDATEMSLTQLHGYDPPNPQPGSGNTAPYMLISASINLPGSRDLTRKDRKSGYFLFSKYYCGSRHTGYRKTEHWRDGETQLSRAITISGAAVSSVMGMNTFFAEAFVVSMFNLRLGYWMSNPRWNQSDRLVFWPRYMFQEMFATTNERRPLVNLSDGGHTGDNVGIYPLLERRCQVIIACDAEADGDLSFGSFTEALRHAYVDLGVDIDIDLSMIRPDPETGLSRSHCAIGRIRYPECPDRPNWLIYLKNSMTGDEPAPVINYKKTCPDFPHESTADQFFDDAQFESYRALGVHIVETSLGWWAERRDVMNALRHPGI